MSFPPLSSSPQSLLHWICILAGSWEKDSQATFISTLFDLVDRRKGVWVGVGGMKKKAVTQGGKQGGMYREVGWWLVED